MQDKNKNITGDRQSDFAGTNPDRYHEPAPAERQDNPIQDQEAQNVTDDQSRSEGNEAEDMRRKANQGKQN